MSNRTESTESREEENWGLCGKSGKKCFSIIVRVNLRISWIYKYEMFIIVLISKVSTIALTLSSWILLVVYLSGVSLSMLHYFLVLDKKLILGFVVQVV